MKVASFFGAAWAFTAVIACSSEGSSPPSSAVAGASGSGASTGRSDAAGGAGGAELPPGGASSSSRGGTSAGAGSYAGFGGGGATTGGATTGGATTGGATTGGATTGSAGRGGSSVDPGSEGDGAVEIGPTYPSGPAADLTDRGKARGKSFRFEMSSADSKFYNGDDATLNATSRGPFTRRVDVYIPASFVPGVPAPFLVIHDGPAQIGLVLRALDNLTVTEEPRRLPAFVAIAVANGGGDSKGSQRGLEYDTMSDRFARFINEEVVPAVENNTGIRADYPGFSLTKDPEGRAAMGCSSGGAAALAMGWFRPDLFRRIITYSGTFVDQQDDDAAEEQAFPLGAWEYHSGLKLIEAEEKKPLRIFLHHSDGDNGASQPESGHHNWVMANQRTAAALAARGYHYRHLTAVNAGHCSGKLFDATLADTLIWAWRGFSAQ